MASLSIWRTRLFVSMFENAVTQCELRTSNFSITLDLLEMQSLNTSPGLMNTTCIFKRVLRWYECTANFENNILRYKVYYSKFHSLILQSSNVSSLLLSFFSFRVFEKISLKHIHLVEFRTSWVTLIRMSTSHTMLEISECKPMRMYF